MQFVIVQKTAADTEFMHAYQVQGWNQEREKNENLC